MPGNFLVSTISKRKTFRKNFLLLNLSRSDFTKKNGTALAKYQLKARAKKGLFRSICFGALGSVHDHKWSKP